MVKMIPWRHGIVRMNACRACGVGAGVTLYPDGPFEHAQRRLTDDLCDDCLALERRKRRAGGGGRVPPSSRRP